MGDTRCHLSIGGASLQSDAPPHRFPFDVVTSYPPLFRDDYSLAFKDNFGHILIAISSTPRRLVDRVLRPARCAETDSAPPEPPAHGGKLNVV